MPSACAITLVAKSLGDRAALEGSENLAVTEGLGNYAVLERLSERGILQHGGQGAAVERLPDRFQAGAAWRASCLATRDARRPLSTAPRNALS